MRHTTRIAMLALALTVVFSAGCMKHTFVVGQGAAQEDSNEVYDAWHAHWLFGLIGNKEVSVKKLCPSGHATIYERTSFINGLVAAFVGIIYYPTTVTVYCRGGHGKADIEGAAHPVAKIRLDRHQAAAIVASPKFLDLVRDVAPDKLAQARKAQARARAVVGQDPTRAATH